MRTVSLTRPTSKAFSRSPFREIVPQVVVAFDRVILTVSGPFSIKSTTQKMKVAPEMLMKTKDR